MKVMKVDGGVLSVGQGVVVLISPAQHKSRTYGIGKAEPVGDAMLCVASTVLQFKSGEVLGIEGAVPKPHAHLVRPATPEDGDAARSLLAAAATLGPPEAAPAAMPKPAPQRRR